MNFQPFLLKLNREWCTCFWTSYYRCSWNSLKISDRRQSCGLLATSDSADPILRAPVGPHGGGSRASRFKGSCKGGRNISRSSRCMHDRRRQTNARGLGGSVAPRPSYGNELLLIHVALTRIYYRNRDFFHDLMGQSSLVSESEHSPHALNSLGLEH